MDSNVLVALISGMFSLAAAIGGVYLKDYLDTRRLRRADARLEKPQPKPAPDASPTRATGGKSWIRPIVIVLGSIFVGVITGATRPPFIITGLTTHYASLLLVPLILFSLGLSIYHRRRGFQIPYQLEILALWAGWASGWSFIYSGVWSDLLTVAIPWWLGCALIGGLVVSVRRPTHGTP